MRRRTTLIASLAAAALAVGGCNIIAPIGYLAHGPEKVKRVHQLDPMRPTVVFIDDPGNRVPRRQLRAVMGQTAEEIMLKKSVIKADDKVNYMVSSQSALVVAGKDKSTEPMSITQIGRAVDAEVVVWVTIDQFSLTADGQSFSPASSARVKVIDAVADQRVFPDDNPNGYSLVLRYPVQSAYMPSSNTEWAKAELDLAQYTGRAIAELFYNEERPTSARAGKK